MELPDFDDLDNGGEGEASTWSPVDLSDALAGRDAPPPTILARSDGIHLVYPARVHWFQGESESMKSWCAQVAVAQELNKGNNVLYVDYEDEARAVIKRLLDLGVPCEAIAAHLTYVRPEEPLATLKRSGETVYTAHAVILGQLLEDHDYALAVIDGVTEAMVIEGLDINSNTDAAAFMRRLPKRIARTGVAVICIDHVTKSADGRGRYAIGAQHKLAGVDGATYEFVVLKPLSRATDGESREGAARLVVHKDRPGWIRGKAVGGAIGTLEITAEPTGAVTAVIVPGDHVPAPPLDLVGRIMEHLTTYDGSSARAIEDAVEAKSATVRAALKWLTDDDRRWVRVEKSGRSHLHFITDRGRLEWAS